MRFKFKAEERIKPKEYIVYFEDLNLCSNTGIGPQGMFWNQFYEDPGLRMSKDKPKQTIELSRHSKKAFLKPVTEYISPTRVEWFRMAPVRT